MRPASRLRYPQQNAHEGKESRNDVENRAEVPINIREDHLAGEQRSAYGRPRPRFGKALENEINQGGIERMQTPREAMISGWIEIKEL